MAQRPYPDYVVANDGLVVGITFDYPFYATDQQIGAALQQHNLFFGRIEGQQSLEDFSPGYLGDAAIYVSAIRDFAHWTDVASSTALALQSLGAYVSNVSAFVTQYTNVDITTDESNKFTRAASDPTLFQSPPTFPDNLSKGLSNEWKDLTNVSEWSWTTIALVALGVVVGIELLANRK